METKVFFLDCDTNEFIGELQANGIYIPSVSQLIIFNKIEYVVSYIVPEYSVHDFYEMKQKINVYIRKLWKDQ